MYTIWVLGTQARTVAAEGRNGERVEPGPGDAVADGYASNGCGQRGYDQWLRTVDNPLFAGPHSVAGYTYFGAFRCFHATLPYMRAAG